MVEGRLHQAARPARPQRRPGSGAFVDGMFHEEWFGLTSQGNGNDSPNMRQLRKAYYTVQKYWRN